MPRHFRIPPGNLDAPTSDENAATSPAATEDPAPPSLSELGVAGISRRRIAWSVVVVVAAWIVVAFAGQAAAAAQATADVNAARAEKVAVTAQTEALRRELVLVTEQRWILQQARAYQLGSRKERPFALAPGAPSLPPDAPGSPARRLGVQESDRTPLEAWLEVLFGPQR